ncbi:glutamate decarboxylase, partial [Cetobacterium sp.]
RWRKRAQALGIDINAKKPNLIVSSGFQVVWEKFCVYWDVELRELPMKSLEELYLDPKAAVAACDEYTIGIVPIMGITYTGTFDDIVALDKAVEEYNKTAKISVPIHVDAASGGLYLPFVNPELVWDFRLKNVISISTSGHKFGLVYPGLGWVMWRDKQYLPEELLFKVAYLGAFEPTFQINFSRPGSQIWAQYYNFVRWGREGYKAVHEKSRDVGLFLTKGLEKLEIFKILNSGENIPIVCWMLKADEKRAWTEYDLADRLRYYGWQLPAYPLPKNLEDVSIMRVVVRADQSMEQISLLLKDMKDSIDYLNEHVTVKKDVQKTEDTVVGYSHNEKRYKK